MTPEEYIKTELKKLEAIHGPLPKIEPKGVVLDLEGIREKLSTPEGRAELIADIHKAEANRLSYYEGNPSIVINVPIP